MKSDALYYFKLALRYSGKKAAGKYLGEFILAGGNLKGLKQRLKTLDPLSGMNDAKKAAFLASLNAEQLEQLARAYEYYVGVLAGEGEKCKHTTWKVNANLKDLSRHV